MSVKIAALGTANPPMRMSQEDSFQAYLNFWPLSEKAQRFLKRIFVYNKSIGYRHFAVDQPSDILKTSQDELIARYRRFAVPVSVQAAQEALGRAHLTPTDIDAVVVNSCTGFLCPGLTSYVAEALELRPDIHPFDLQGMGCGGALPNLETGYSFVQANPDSTVLSIAVEMCSATLFLDEARDILVTNALFGDGAAAAVLTRRETSGHIQLAAFSAGLYPEDRRLLYYRHENSKLRNVLTVEVPEAGARHAKQVIEKLLLATGHGIEDIDHWVIHPGGQKVLDAFEEAFALPGDALQPSRTVLYNYGNMSSASVLFVLDKLMQTRQPKPGDLGIMCSFGAGFSAYAALLEF